MSHQPPVPAGNQSPYPLQEAPHSHDSKPSADTPVSRTPGSSSSGSSSTDAIRAHLPALSGGVIGALAAVGIAALAAAGAWAYTSRKDAARPKRKDKKGKRARA